MFTAKHATEISNMKKQEKESPKIEDDLEYIYQLIMEQAFEGKNNLDLMLMSSEDNDNPIIAYSKRHRGKTSDEVMRFYLLDVQKSVINNGFRIKTEEPIFRIYWK